MIVIHRDQIERYGGSLGIRDAGLLESALAMPAASFGGQYLHQDIYAMAAAYLFHLVKNHPFIDGNKRVGAMAAYAFLDLNGIELKEALDKKDEPEWFNYSPAQPFAQEEEHKQRDEELAKLQESLDEAHRKSFEEALQRPPPITVRAYQSVFGGFPRGWPPQV